MVLPILGIVAAGAHLPPLHVDGRRLLDPSGKEVILRGTNLGNWLVVEFWMLGLDHPPKDQFDMESILTGRFGEAEKDRLMDLYRASWITERDFKTIPIFGFNCVRLPMNYRLMEDDRHPFHLKKDAWKWIDRAVDLAEQNGLYTILDMHGAQGGQSPYDHTGHSGQNHLKDSVEDQQRLAWLWGELAQRYRNRSAVVAYDVWNEPYGTPKSMHKGIFERSLKAIRQVDPEKLVYAMGNFDGYDQYGDPKANGWHNVGFQMHYYPGLFGGGSPTIDTQVKHLRSLGGVQKDVQRLNVPFYVGEMNVVFDKAGGADMMRRTFDLHAKYGWATTMWSYKVYSKEGGIGDAFWGMVANASPAPQIDFRTDTEAAIEAYFRSFATAPLVVNQPLRKALGDRKYRPAPLPEPPPKRTTAPQETWEGWNATDVGGALAGGLERRGEDFSLYGGGRDVWGSRDEFRFLNRSVSGDFTLEVEVRSVEALDQYTKAGLMVRASDAPDAPFVLLSVFPDGGLQLAHRDTLGGEATAPAMVDGSVPVRLRLERKAGVISGSYWKDGAWRTIASTPDRLPSTVRLGPIVSSHDAGGLAKVEYAGLKLAL